MTTLTRWDPFRELTTIHDRMNRLFQDVYFPNREERLSTTAFAPPTDIYEDENHVTLKLEVPGIDEKDLDIRVENNNLIIKGERNLRRKKEKRTSDVWSGTMGHSCARFRCPALWTPTT